jgi:ParB family chromosome partitioning protein
MHAPVACVWLPIDQILVPPGHRDLRRLGAYMDSMRAVQQLQPILVVPQEQAYRLVFGRGRLEAATRLGWTHVLAIIRDLDDRHAELAMLDENLVREELTVLERADHFCRRKAIYEQLYPETRMRGGPGRGHRQKRRKHFAPFAEEMAARMGYTPRTIQQEVEIATHLSEAVKAVIRPLPIANRKVDLMRLAKLPPDAQAAVAQRLQSGASATFNAAARALGLTGRPPAATVETAQADHALALSVSPEAEAPNALDRDAFLRLVVAALHDAIAEREVAGQPVTAVLAERLAALPWPELVLLARGLTGPLAEAAAAWVAAVDEETAERGVPQQGETGQGHPREDESGAPRATGQAHVTLGAPDSPPSPPLPEGSIPVTTREDLSDAVPPPVDVPHTAVEGVGAANTQSPEVDTRPEDGRPPDDEVCAAEASDHWPDLPADHLPEPSTTVHHGLDHGEDHGASRAPVPAAHHTPLPSTCPQCGASKVWRVYGASSGRIACLTCQHHFLPTDQTPSTPLPWDGVQDDAGDGLPVSRAMWEQVLIETLRLCHAVKVRWSARLTVVSASSEGGLAASTSSPCRPSEGDVGEVGGAALKKAHCSADAHHGLVSATPGDGTPCW